VWIYVDIVHQGGQWKQRKMMTIFSMSKDHHLYGNGNQDTTTFLEIGVEVDKNGVATTKIKFPLEIT